VQRFLLIPCPPERSPQDALDLPEQGIHFGFRADRDPEVVANRGCVEPPDEDPSVTELAEPFDGGEPRGMDQEEIGLTGKDAESEPGEGLVDALPGGTDPVEATVVVGEAGERGEGGDLAQAINVVAVPDFVQGGHEVRVTHHVTDAKGAEGVGFGKRPGDENIRVFQGQNHRVRTTEVDIGLVEHHDALLSPAEPVQFGDGVGAPTGGVGCGDESEGCSRIAPAFTAQHLNVRQSEVGPEWNGVPGGTVDIGKDRVKRIAGDEVLDRGGRRAGVASVAPRVPRRFCRTG